MFITPSPNFTCINSNQFIVSKTTVSLFCAHVFDQLVNIHIDSYLLHVLYRHSHFNKCFNARGSQFFICQRSNVSLFLIRLPQLVCSLAGWLVLCPHRCWIDQGRPGMIRSNTASLWRSSAPYTHHPQISLSE